MAATDFVTPLNAANVLHKISDDQHTGQLANMGNMTVQGGYFTLASVGGVPAEMENRFVLGGGYLIIPYMFQADPYPAAIGTYYYPVAFYHAIQFGGFTDVIPTFITSSIVNAYKNNCTLTLFTAYNTYSVGRRCVLLRIAVTTRTSASAAYVPYAEGHVQVGA